MANSKNDRPHFMQPIEFYPYTVVEEKAAKEKRIIDINGLLFTNSDSYGTPISGLWKPILGVDPQTKQLVLPPQDSELANTLCSMFAASLEKITNHDGLDAAMGALRQFHMKLDPKITPKNFFKSISDELATCGSMEAVVIALMIQKPKIENNKIMMEFLTQLANVSPAYNYYLQANLPMQIDIALRNNDTSQDPEKMNGLLLKNRKQTGRPEKSTTGNYLALLGAASLVAGGLLLGDILNVGVLAGVGGAIFAGLTTAAALTGLGLLVLGAVLLAVGLVMAWGPHQQQLTAFTQQQDAVRAPVVAFLEAHSGLEKAPVVKNITFFAAACKAVGEALQHITPKRGPE